MAFKKIDADAVNADEPLDAFVLQGVDANLDAAHEGRLRRTSVGWPADAEPTYAAHKMIALSLGKRPIHETVTTVSIDIIHDVVNANVNVGLAKMTNAGLSLNEEDLLDSSLAATDQVGAATGIITTLTVDVSAERGSVADLYLLILSDISTTPAQEELTTTGNIIENTNKIRLPNGHGITLFGTAGDRWTLRFDEASSGSNLTEGDHMPGQRTVIKMLDAAGDTELWLWPNFGRGDYDANINFAQGNYKVTVDTLGHTILRGISMYEAVDAYGDIQGRLLPGKPPVAGAIQELYGRGRRIHSEQTRVYHCGPTYDRSRVDPGSTELTVWGEAIDISESYQTLGACWVGTYARNNINGGSSRYKNKIRVAGTLAVVSNFEASDAVGRIGVRASVYTYSGGWTGSVTNGTAATYSAQVMAVSQLEVADTNESAPLFMFGSRGLAGQSWHYLRGALGGDDLSNTGARLVAFDVEVEDAQTTAGDRMLRLEVIGVSARPGAFGINPEMVHCLSMTAWEAEGTVAT